MEIHPLIDRPKFSLSQAVPITNQSAHEPDVVVDHEGTPWIVWSERGRAGDRIRFRKLEDGGRGTVLSGEPGIVFQPTATVIGDGRILVVWTSYLDGGWRLESRFVENGTAVEQIHVSAAVKGFFHPCLVTLADGSCQLAAEQVVNQKSTIARFRLQGTDWLKEPIGTAAGDCFRPSLVPGPDDGLWLSYDCYRDGRSDVFLQRIDRPEEPIAVTDDGFQDVQSDLASDSAGNLWIAWASNANKRENPWWLTKYVEVVRFDGAEFTEPDGPMPDRDIYNEDSWQGWEFPGVSVDSEGRVWLFGQASHTLYAQFYDGDGWSERFDIAPRRWGSWKPRIRVAGSDPIFIVGMGLGGAQMQRLSVKGTTYQVPGTGDRTVRAGVKVTHDGWNLQRPTSNVQRPTSNLQLFFGDLHCHSIYGDAMNDVDEIYRRYRDAYGYDFAALTEHDYLDGMELSRSELNMMWAHADRMTVSGAFVAFYGYEWTTPAVAAHAGGDETVGEGHRHVLYPEQSGPLVSYGEEDAKTAEGLLKRLAGRRALVIQHHTGWSGTNWDACDPELSRLIEICSTHGRFEYEDNWPIGHRRDHVHPGKFVLDGLARGLRFGFVGGSDSHGLLWHATELEGRSSEVPAGTRVGWKEDAYRTGMTAILAPELTRDALFEALYRRRCYATSGVPIEVDFRVDGSLMGSEIEVASPPRISAGVRGTAELDMIQIVRSGSAIFARSFGLDVSSHDAHLEMVDSGMEPGKSAYYYLRVIQRDGNMAWSSPIWVSWPQ